MKGKEDRRKKERKGKEESLRKRNVQRNVQGKSRKETKAVSQSEEQAPGSSQPLRPPPTFWPGSPQAAPGSGHWAAASSGRRAERLRDVFIP